MSCEINICVTYGVRLKKRDTHVTVRDQDKAGNFETGRNDFVNI